VKKRQKKTKLYSTDNLFVYETGNQTLAIEGVIEGKRIRQRAKTLEEAKAKCHALEEGQQGQNVARTILDAQQLRDAEHAISLLKSEVSLTEAVKFYLEKFSPQSSISLTDAIWQYLGTKEGRASRTYTSCKNSLLRFDKWAGDRVLSDITRTDAREFLNTLPSGSYDSVLRLCKGLYIWAVQSEHCITNPFDFIKPRGRLKLDVDVLTCEQVEALLVAARDLEQGDLLAYMSLCIFAGLRPNSEAVHLTWDQINLADAEVRVIQSKTKTPRTVELSSNLVQWLMTCDKTKPIYPKNFKRKFGRIKRAAGFRSGLKLSEKEKELEVGHIKWTQDITRKTAISYKVREIDDEGKAATWAGNSVGVIRRHYKGLVSSSDAQKFWGIQPESSLLKQA